MFRYSTIFSLFLFFNFFVLNNTYSQLFSYTDGTFEKNGNSWVEKAKEGRIFYFQEYKKDENFYFINDNSRGVELQVPILGGWVNIKTGKGGPVSLWSKLYFVTLNPINKNTSKTNSNEINQKFKTCFHCGKKLLYGENYFYNGASWGIETSYKMEYGINDRSNELYKGNWDSKITRVCCSKNCSDADGRQITIKRQQEESKKKVIDAKTPVARSRNCDYCERTIYYKQRYYTKSSSGTINGFEFQLSDPIKYNQTWRGEGGWESGKIIYCSKKCANESPTK